MVEEPEARHQGRARRSILQRVRAIPAGQVVRTQAHDFRRDGDGDRLRLDQGRPVRQGIREDAHGRVRQVEGLSSRRGGRHCEDAGVARERDRRSGKRRARARARMGQEARLSRAGRLGQWPRRRLPQPDRHPMGARHGVPDRDAGVRQARHQHGQFAVGMPAGFPVLFPGLRRRRHVGRSRKHRDAGRALSTHAAVAEHGDDLPAHPAAAHTGSDRRRKGGRLSVGRKIHRASICEILIPGARPRPRAHDVQVRRLHPLDHEQHQSLGADVSVAKSRIRGQPIDLVRGRGQVRRSDSACVHQFRARRYQRVGGARRLRPPRPAATESPGHHIPGAGHRAARGIEVGFLDLQRDL